MLNTTQVRGERAFGERHDHRVAAERRRLPAVGPHGGPRRAAPRVVPVRPREGARQGSTALAHQTAAAAATDDARGGDIATVVGGRAGEQENINIPGSMI